MTLLQLIIIVTGFIFLLFSVDLYERRKFNLLHFLVFFGGTGGIVFFIIRPDLLDRFGDFFGLTRGADLIVYTSIIFLAYLYFELLNKQMKQRIVITSLLSMMTLQNSGPKIENMKEKVYGKRKEYCFLVRAYNESSIIESVIIEIFEYGFSKIVVCDDGSTDGTVNIIKSLQKKYPGLILLEHPFNRGPGAANKTLFARANKHSDDFGINWFITYDADGQMNIKDIEKFIDMADTGQYEVLLGSRFMEGGSVDNITKIRRILLRGSKFITLIFNRIYVTDPTNGYKAIHRDALKKIYLESDGFMYASEFLEQIQKNKLKWIEIPVKIIYTEYSKGKGQKSSNAWKILKKLIYRELFYK